MNDKEILEKLLEITEEKKAGRQFLHQFRSLQPETFAILFASPEIIAESGEALHYEIKLLYHVHLFPVLVLHKDSLSYIRNFYFFSKKDEKNKTKIPVSIFRKSHDTANKVIQSIRQNRIPVIITTTSKDDIFPFLQNLAQTLQTLKLIYLWSYSGIRDNTDSILYNIYINKGFDDILMNYVKNKEDIWLLRGIQNIFLGYANPKFSAVVTAPVSLLKELFTVKGSGTLIKRGCRILISHTLEAIDKKRLVKLMEEAFRKKLSPLFLERKFDLFLVESEYRGCAILQKTADGFFLSKYAVDDIARGEGIGGEIWEQMRKNCDRIFWRAKRENPINQWYWEKSDGMLKTEKWFIFWIGVEKNKIPQIADFLLHLEEDFS